MKLRLKQNVGNRLVWNNNCSFKSVLPSFVIRRLSFLWIIWMFQQQKCPCIRYVNTFIIHDHFARFPLIANYCSICLDFIAPISYSESVSYKSGQEYTLPNGKLWNLIDNDIQLNLVRVNNVSFVFRYRLQYGIFQFEFNSRWIFWHIFIDVIKQIDGKMARNDFPRPNQWLRSSLFAKYRRAESLLCGLRVSGSFGWFHRGIKAIHQIFFQLVLIAFDSLSLAVAPSHNIIWQINPEWCSLTLRAQRDTSNWLSSPLSSDWDIWVENLITAIALAVSFLVISTHIIIIDRTKQRSVTEMDSIIEFRAIRLR